MRFYSLLALLVFPFLNGAEQLPDEILKIMHQPKYDHSIWGIYAKDLETGKVLYDLNSDLLFSPASTTKLFSAAALVDAYGDDYRFKTPVYADGKIENGVLKGNLVLVGQGDLTFGGRQSDPDHISFTKMDHIIANNVPGVILTKEDPLQAIDSLAKQVAAKGIREVQGNVVIDDTLFETTEKRGMILTPVMINENLIDIVLNPSSSGEKANLTFRPQVKGFSAENQVKTVPAGEPLAIDVTSADGHHIIVKGSIPADQKDIVRTFSIQDPKAYAKAAFIQALEKNGIKVSQANIQSGDRQQVALWTSPPLSETVKLILKVSHNLGADLIPLLLAAKQGKKTFDEGMLLFGNFVTEKVKVSPNEFTFADAAGGDENRLTPQAEMRLLEYMQKQNAFKNYKMGQPILGTDGSLEDVARNTSGAGKVFGKTGTGAVPNLATGQLFLTTEAQTGYIDGKNGHLWGYMVVVNNVPLPSIEDVLTIFEDEGQISSLIYDHTGN